MIIYAKRRMYHSPTTDRNNLLNQIYRDAIVYFLCNFRESIALVGVFALTSRVSYFNNISHTLSHCSRPYKGGFVNVSPFSTPSRATNDDIPFLTSQLWLDDVQHTIL